MTPETILDSEPDGALASIEQALSSPDPAEALRKVAAQWPACLQAWARLGQVAYESGDEVGAYAFFRTGYHRGLDRLRAAGWRGAGPAPWRHENNRGFLRALHGLMVAAAAIGEGVEARRCREFLLSLDTDDELGVGSIRPADLNRRLPEPRRFP